MSIRDFIYLFPDTENLDFINVFELIKTFGLDIDNNAFIVDLDQNGYYEETGNMITVTENDIKNMLIKKDMFYLEISTKNIFFNILFACKGSNPHISINWYKNMFNRLNHNSKKYYYQCLKKIMQISKSGYVIFFEESFENFENNFILFNEQRILDNKVYYDGIEFSPVEKIWINEKSKKILGVNLIKEKKLDNGFIIYGVENYK